MKIKEGLQLRKVAGASVVVATGDAAKDYKGMFNLNDTAALLFERLEKGATREELVAELLSKYDVSPEQALDSVERFIKELEKADLLA